MPFRLNTLWSQEAISTNTTCARSRNIIVDDLGIGKYLNPKQIDRVMRNVTELHKASMPSRALKFGSVMAFVMISAAVMAAHSDSRRGNGDTPYPVTP